MALTISIHNNEVEISSGMNKLLVGEKSMINLEYTVTTYNQYITDSVPNLVGNYFTSDNEVTITYSQQINNSIVHIVDQDESAILTDKYNTYSKHELYKLYLDLALKHRCTPILVYAEDAAPKLVYNTEFLKVYDRNSYKTHQVEYPKLFKADHINATDIRKNFLQAYKLLHPKVYEYLCSR